MAYFKLVSKGFSQRWEDCDYDPQKRQISLFGKLKGKMFYKGIGLY